MRTHIHALYSGAVAVGFSLSSFALDWAETPDAAVRKAKEQDKDVLFVYTAPGMGEAGLAWVNALDRNDETTGRLAEQFVPCKIILPRQINPRDPGEAGNSLLALKHGINVVPSAVLADKEGRIYNRVPGGVVSSADISTKVSAVMDAGKTRARRDDCFAKARSETDADQKEKFLLGGLQHVPVETWADAYPDVMQSLAELGCEDDNYLAALDAGERIRGDSAILTAAKELPVAPEGERLDEAIKLFEDLAESDFLSFERKQFVLLSYVYPLYVLKTSQLYQGGTNGKLEEAFNRSVELLEQIRDMDRTTKWGKHAHTLREELRKARLAAAKYD